jgi:hypothetical protein
MARVSDRLYQSVASSSSETSDFVVANGKVLTVYTVGGDAGASPDTVVEVTWDPGGGEEQCLFITHGSASHDLRNQGLKFNGDGSKKIRITITNDQTEADSLGAFWEGREV